MWQLPHAGTRLLRIKVGFKVLGFRGLGAGGLGFGQVVQT